MIYFDFAATAPLRPEVLVALEKALRDVAANPSSIHRLGLQAETALRQAREQVAGALGVSAEEIVFTSGGTESNNMAVKGLARNRRARGQHIVTSLAEHSSVLESVRALEKEGFSATYVEPGTDGRVSADAILDAVRDDTVLVSVQVVNNETGALQPVAEIGRRLQERRRPPRFHVDAVQALGRVPLELAAWGVDAASFSAHKLGGPKGVGFMYLRRGVEVEPLLHGGGQERGLRSGTENVPGIVGAAVAAELAARELPQASAHMGRLMEMFLARVEELVPDIAYISPREREARAPHIVALSVPGLRGEVVLHALEERNVYVSTGSACSSRRGKQSHVLAALGADAPVREGMIRISLGPVHTEQDVEQGAKAFAEAVQELRAALSVGHA